MTNFGLPHQKMQTLRCSFACLLAAIFAALPLPAAAKETLLLLDRSQSRIDIAVKSTVDSFVARLDNFDVAITVDSESSRVKSTVFHAPLSAVKTGRPDRDSDMNAWLQTARFPQVRFDLAAIDSGPDGALTARSRFQLHGQEHDVSFPVKIVFDHGSVAIDGVAALDTRLFGLPIIRKFLVLTVDPVVRVRFHLIGRAAPVDPPPGGPRGRPVQAGR